MRYDGLTRFLFRLITSLPLLASAAAELPPPITATSFPLKNAPSQAAHQLTPRPRRASSPGMPRARGAAPAA